MNTPTGCPKCGAKIRHQLTSIREYECRSYESGPSFVQTTICEQRDPQKLNERIAALQRHIEIMTKAGDRLTDLLCCSMGLHESDEWANSMGALKVLMASDAIADWCKVIEDKP